MRAYIEDLSLSVPALVLFAATQDLQISLARSVTADASLSRLAMTLVKLQTQTHDFENVAAALLALRAVAPSVLVDHLRDVLVPLGLILRVVTGVNHFIIAADVVRRHDFLVIEFPNFTNVMQIVRYERASLFPVSRLWTLDSFILELCSEIEAAGTPLLHSSCDEFNVSDIIVPNIGFIVRLHALTANVAALAQFRDDLLLRPLSGPALFEAEQTLASIECAGEALGLLGQIRRIHHLFLALDLRKVISYSNAVILMYFRTFSTQMIGRDFFGQQRLIIPLMPNALLALNDELDRRSASADRREPALLRLRLEAAECRYPSDVYKALFLGRPAECDPPADLAEVIAEACAAAPDEGAVITFIRDIIETEIQRPALAIAVSGFAADYLALLRVVEDQGLVEDALPIGIDNFEALFSVHFSSIRVERVSEVIEPIEDALGPFCGTNCELYSQLSHMRRGCFGSETVADLTALAIGAGDDVLQERLRRLNVFVVFLDLADEIGRRSRFSGGRSLLRELNTKSFCESLVKRLLFLNTSSRIELPPTVSRLRTVEHDDEFVSGRHLQGVIVSLMRQFPAPDEAVLRELSERFKGSLEDEAALLEMTFGFVPIELRGFVGFLQDQALRACAPVGAFMTSTDLNGWRPPASPTPVPVIVRPTLRVPFGLLAGESQDALVAYLERLEAEREALLPAELAMQQATEQRSSVQSALAEARSQRAALVDRFMTLRKAVAPAVRRDSDNSDAREPGSEWQTASQMHIAVESDERKLKVLEDHREIISEKVKIGTTIQKLRQYRRFQMVEEDEVADSVRKISDKRRRTDGSRPATLPPPLAMRMRPWNTVTTAALDEIQDEVRSGGDESEDSDGKESPCLRRRIAEIDTVLSKFT
jgi:hypothetical protein